MPINIPGIVSVLVFCLVIFGVGAWAAWKQRRKGNGIDAVMLASRNIGVYVGFLTMTATWVGGGFINGSAEVIFTTGLLWCQTPIGYSISLLLGGLLFAKPMRERGYVTMIDPFQEKYGQRIGGLLFLPALCGEVLWCGSILSALGSMLTVICDLHYTAAILISAAMAVGYMFCRGLYTAAYTDALQLFLILFGLVICLPFAWSHPAVNMNLAAHDWVGKVEGKSLGNYLDLFMLLIFGGIPWQTYFQQILSAKTAQQAQLLSYAAAVGCLLMAIPSIVVGFIAKTTDWENGTDYHQALVSKEQTTLVLPLVLQYLTPNWVSFFGLGAVSAAVMSSADSSILSSSSMFVHNIYKGVFMQKASEKHIGRVLWVSLLLVVGLATIMALSVTSIYGLSYLCSDLVYVVLFPQLLLVVYWNKHCNTYGCLAGYFIGLVLRLLSGEDLLNLPPVIHYPSYDNQSGKQLFPFRTFVMLVSLVTHMSVSWLTTYAFWKLNIPKNWDVLGCFSELVEIIDRPVTREMDGPITTKEKHSTTDIGSQTKKYTSSPKLNVPFRLRRLGERVESKTLTKAHSEDDTERGNVNLGFQGSLDEEMFQNLAKEYPY